MTSTPDGLTREVFDSINDMIADGVPVGFSAQGHAVCYPWYDVTLRAAVDPRVEYGFREDSTGGGRVGWVLDDEDGHRVLMTDRENGYPVSDKAGWCLGETDERGVVVWQLKVAPDGSVEVEYRGKGETA